MHSRKNYKKWSHDYLSISANETKHNMGKINYWLLSKVLGTNKKIDWFVISYNQYIAMLQNQFFL